MTFIVIDDGVVYQKDVGRTTDARSKAMKEYNVDAGRRKAEAQQEETAAAQKAK